METSGSKTSLLSIHQLQSFTCLSKYNVCPSNPGSNVIHIKKANYGRTDETTCSSGRPAHQLSNTNCYAPTTLPIISERSVHDTKVLLCKWVSLYSSLLVKAGCYVRFKSKTASFQTLSLNLQVPSLNDWGVLSRTHVSLFSFP